MRGLHPRFRLLGPEIAWLEVLVRHGGDDWWGCGLRPERQAVRGGWHRDILLGDPLLSDHLARDGHGQVHCRAAPRFWIDVGLDLVLPFSSKGMQKYAQAVRKFYNFLHLLFALLLYGVPGPDFFDFDRIWEDFEGNAGGFSNMFY